MGKCIYCEHQYASKLQHIKVNGPFIMTNRQKGITRSVDDFLQ